MGLEDIPPLEGFRPLGKDGYPMLIPELIEEDFDVATAIVRRFASSGASFTLSELRTHLQGNNVQLPDDPDEFLEMFEEMEDVILAHYADRREGWAWHRQEVGKKVLYTLVEIATYDAIETVDLPAEPTAAKAGPATAAESAAEPPSKKPPTLSGQTLSAVFGSQSLLRVKQIVDLVAATMRVDAQTAADLIANTRDAGGLFKHNILGVTYIGREPPESPAPADTGPTGTEAERHLTEAEIGIMVRVMDRLTDSGKHVTQGETIKALRQALDIGSGPAFNRLLRIMEDQRLVRIDSTANYGKARKSPRVHVRGQDMKQRWASNREAYINRLRKTTIPD